MNKSELAQKIAESLCDPSEKDFNYNYKLAYKAVDIFFQEIKEALNSGEKLEIRGLGTFMTKHYKAYRGRNPKDGREVNVPAKVLPVFKVSKILLKTLNS